MLEVVNYINNNNYYNRAQQNQGWNQQRPNYSACRSDTQFPKGDIEEPLRPSWYLVRSSRLHGDRDYNTPKFLFWVVIINQ